MDNENKIQAPRKMVSLKDCLSEVDGLSNSYVTLYERLTLAVQLQANYIESHKGDYEDEHAYYRTNAILAVRDAITEFTSQQ